MIRTVICVLVLEAGLVAQVDARTLYDVITYRLDLTVDCEQKEVSGTVGVEALVVGATLAEVELDARVNLEIEEVRFLEKLTPKDPFEGVPVGFRRDGDRVLCVLPHALQQGATVRVALRFKNRSSRMGLSWSTSADGRPWMGSSCQGPGAHSWWPCKASWYHPEDKHRQLYVNLTVPEGLYGVSNGRLAGRTKPGSGFETFHWDHPYPCETYAVAVNVGPYVVVEDKLTLEGIDEPVPWNYYVLPENLEKAQVQFAQVNELLSIYSKAFGPYPFPKAKFALVDAPFWGMEHSTVVAYGSSYPEWCKKTGAPDRHRGRNKFFDYILIHEVAHEWWGNGVSANDWGHFWIHEGFGTYAEGVYVEFKDGREAADRYFRSILGNIGPRTRLYRGKGVNSRQAYGGVLYYKGAWVLNTLRHYVDDDEAWWKSLREFNLAHRYGCTDTEGFRTILEKNTKKEWKQFFDEWFYGSGYPTLKGKVSVRGKTLRVQIDNEGGRGSFHVPVDVAWKEGADVKTTRLVLSPGKTDRSLECSRPPTDIQVLHLDRILGRHEVVVE